MDLERIDDGGGGSGLGTYADAPLVAAEPRSRGRGRALVLGGLVALVALVAGALVLLGGEDERDPETALARAQEAVREARSVRFSYHAVFEAEGLVDEEEGTEIYDGTAEWTPNAWRIVETSEDETTEWLRVGEDLYDRYDGDDTWTKGEFDPIESQDVVDFAELMGELLGSDLMDDELLEGVDAPELFAPYLSLMAFLHNTDDSAGAFLSDPEAFLGSIQRLSQPTVLSEDGDVLTIAMPVTIDAAIVDAYGHPVPDATVELDLDGDDLPIALRFRSSSSVTDVLVDFSFSAWGEEISIAAPDPADVETWDDIEGSDDFEDFDLEPPTEVPVVGGVTPLRIGAAAGDWKIDMVEVMEGDASCPSLMLSWSEGDGRYAMLGGAVLMTLAPRACAPDLLIGYDLELPVAGPGEMVLLDTSEPFGVDEELFEDMSPPQQRVVVTEDTVAMVFVMAFLDEDATRATAVLDALEITDWETLQGDLAG